MIKIPCPFIKGFYRRNNYGEPYVWYGEVIGTNSIKVYHGIVGKSISNQILFTTKNRKEAEVAFTYMTDGKRVHPYDFEKGVYVLLSEGHYIYHPKALYIINSNTYKV